MKTIQIKYLEDKKVDDYMRKNVKNQKRSAWIRSATFDKMTEEKLIKSNFRRIKK